MSSFETNSSPDILSETLDVTEVYASIQGESTYAGFPCTFIRLTGCPLRCRWCDTAYAFKGGENLSISAIMAKVSLLSPKMVELTGGEPLSQKNSIPLMETLVSQGYQVLIETSGSEDISAVPAKVHIVMDLKCPKSMMSERNRYENISFLKPSDDIKFVVADRSDFDWALATIDRLSLERFNILLSCAFGLVHPKDLCEWILESKRPYKLQLQQHKYIWNPRAKGV